MRELTFFTTSTTKLAHARYVAEKFHIRVKGFRQRSYHAAYVEPRLLSREEILRSSYASAKVQLAKAGFSEDRHPFILEDTSVRIDSLSSLEQEVPGVDIKFWMREQTFAKLDQSLKISGNIRAASVRSDILLHVPSSFKSQWGVDTDYLVFTGEQAGNIVQSEAEFSGNLVFPWLDNQSFNKWFQPEGFDQPLGALSIAAADTVDFRRRSFEKLFSFLESKRFFSVKTIQMELPLDRTKNILVCGYTCAGKTTVSQYLARTYGFLHVEASDFMYLAYYYRHGFSGKISIGDFAEKALLQRPEIAAEKAIEYVMENSAEQIVISGFRAVEEVEYAVNALANYGKEFEARFISSDEDTRFRRLQDRGRPGDASSFVKFQEKDAQQRRMGLDRVEAWSAVKVLENSCSIEVLFKKLDELVGARTAAPIDIPLAFEKIKQISEVGLEDAILISLLSVWSDGESRPFYTTTRMASLINTTFPGIVPKHKDNVSRYFNQDFYVFYEISREERSGARVYRLSNTGYGMAVKILRKYAAKM
jgi:inosine/xanthosine triphosphate pyrophosphatase family protein/dephospho-CoA kinase